MRRKRGNGGLKDMPANIGVFLCDCGKSLKNIDFERVLRELRDFKEVTHVGLSSGLCLEEGLEELASKIRERNIDRIVIAACTPELKESLFQKAFSQARPDSHILFSMANIREQCSWVHESDVTEKAIEMIRMAIGRALLLEDIKEQEVGVTPGVLVIGGSVYGLEIALDFSRLGLRTTLVAREPASGGGSCYANGSDSDEITGSMARQAEEDENIEVLAGASILNLEGHAGNFLLKIGDGGKECSREFGAIVFAEEGTTESLSDELTGISGVFSHRDLVKLMKSPEKLSRKPSVVAFVLDRTGENPRRSTLSALNSAFNLKESLGSEVYVYCKNLKIDSEGAEALYQTARNRGVVFLKYEGIPKIESCEDNRVRIETRDLLLGETVVLFCDLVVVEDRTLPSRAADGLDSKLKGGRDSQGFCQDQNIHLYPVCSRRKGVFFVGGCRGDLDLSRTHMDASSVTLKVYELLSQKTVKSEVQTVKVESDLCRACLTCVRACPHSAVGLVHLEEGGEAAEIHDLSCSECGICGSICPAKAIELSKFSDGQILAEIETMGEGRIVAFCCGESAYRAADRAGRLRINYPAQTRIIRVPCVGRVDILHILKAFEWGAKGVLLMGCQEGACQHLEGSTRAKERVQYAGRLLEETGMDRWRVKMVGLGPDMAHRFAQEISEMAERIEEENR
jgi:heterodisulfide reductase subunit A-like polyferredoxin/coenzyme F420-reducing hydrogenase delta subunit